MNSLYKIHQLFASELNFLPEAQLKLHIASNRGNKTFHNSNKACNVLEFRAVPQHSITVVDFKLSTFLVMPPRSLELQKVLTTHSD